MSLVENIPLSLFDSMPAIIFIYRTEAELSSRETALLFVIFVKTVSSPYKLKYDVFIGIVLSGNC
jgi:hypothetical protein